VRRSTLHVTVWSPASPTLILRLFEVYVIDKHGGGKWSVLTRCLPRCCREGLCSAP
jgi:hypothetical protein